MHDDFYVYENWQAGEHKAVIHRASCGHCKDGQGQKGGTDKAYGKWHPPVSSVAAAEALARGTGANVRYCKTCKTA